MALELNSFVRCVRDSTDRNDHTGAVKFIAVYAARKHSRLGGVGKLVKAVEALEVLQDYYGELTPELKYMRTGLYSAAITLLSIDEAKAFNAAM